MKKILVPTDLSEISLKALDVAADLARHNGAEITLLQVKIFPSASLGTYYSMGVAVPFDTAWKGVLEDAQKELESVITNTKFLGLNIKAIVEESVENFESTLLKHKADLIVMGSTGATGIKEMFGGSHSESIVRHANCPVLVIKGEQQDYQLKKVLVATDMENTDFIKKAFKWLNMPEVEYHFVYVDTAMQQINYEQLKGEMKKVANKLKLKNYHFDIWDGANIEEGILDSAHKIKADLILMYTHGRTGLAHWFKGSIAEDIVNHSDIPVMTLS
ncbi:universal stress protein [Flectobacillus longus]|uniref:universal stress protein n=1 Tax=Flectobacillus longus TaxID=2984207 RepID=UPI0024B755DE|nr:universal stress protein [Flectobacillus longus]MDI9879905.1 universal stress protein [Flectobacillus longus]